jgi:hypothetical protein
MAELNLKEMKDVLDNILNKCQIVIRPFFRKDSSKRIKKMNRGVSKNGVQWQVIFRLLRFLGITRKHSGEEIPGVSRHGGRSSQNL